MSKEGSEQEPIEITPPDPTNKDETAKWLKMQVTVPPAGYDAMTHPDGTPLNKIGD